MGSDGDNDTDDDAVYVCTGGAVPLAEGGVCLLGSVGAMKRELRDKMEKCKSIAF